MVNKSQMTQLAPSRWAPDERRCNMLIVCLLGGAGESEVCWLVGGQGFGVSIGIEIVNDTRDTSLKHARKNAKKNCVFT